jgi:hypothetical protein
MYRLSYACGVAPTKSVAELFEMPRSTAGRWIATARKKGYLGKASPRYAGEER